MSPTLAAGTAERDWGAELYQRHRPEQTLLNRIVEQHYPAFVTHMARQDRPLPDYVQRRFEDYLRCDRLKHSFLPVRFDTCQAEHLVAFSCKRRGFCPNCGARRMAESVALLVDEVFPEQPIRQWGEGRPFVRWTNAAPRTTGQEVRAGTPRHGWQLPHVVSTGDSPAVQGSWARCSASSIASSPRT